MGRAESGHLWCEDPPPTRPHNGNVWEATRVVLPLPNARAQGKAQTLCPVQSAQVHPGELRDG